MDKETNSDQASAFQAPDPAELSALLSGYVISDLIARGGMGAVYLARQESLDRDVAIKILPRELGADPEFRASFQSEARAMARLRHPNLIAVHDFGEVDGFLYLVMDFIKGKSLFHSAHGKAIDQEEAARLVHAICEGVAHAHEEGIIHRDLKPANILLNPQKQPCIGDFGHAHHTNSDAGSGMHFGTPDYLAPELMKDSAKASKQSDVYSIGVILFELLTGELPGQSYVPPSQIQKVDLAFDKIVRRALHPAPAMRYGDTRQMAKELETLMAALCKPGANLVTRFPAESLPGDKKSRPDPASAALAGAASEKHRKALIRNLVIIVVLLVAILIVSAAYKRKKGDLADSRERVDGEPAVQVGTQPTTGSARKPPIRRGPDPESTREPVPEARTLSDLKEILASGERKHFPAGTSELGEQRIFLVNNPMNWQEARKFAEEHGGHLATVVDEDVKTAVTSTMPEGATVWLGGGITGPATWGWIDGSPWTWSVPAAPSTGSYLQLSQDGTIGARAGKTRLPFFIQWNMSGDNPGTVEAQLERLKNSLAEADPLYPPGVLSSEDRRYWIVEKEVTWEEADERSRMAGGHLAVPSDQSENTYLQKAVSTILPDQSAVWLGGRFQEGSWTWTSGEPWTFSAWSPKPPHLLRPSHTALRLLCGGDGGWDNVDPDEEGIAAAFVIEWSKDRLASGKPATTGSPLDLANLKKQTAATIDAKRDKHGKLILKNGAAMVRDLADWINNGLHRAVRARYRNLVILAQRKVLQSGRIDVESPFPPLPADIGGTCNGYLKKQQLLDAQLEQSLETDRTALLEQLTGRLETARSQRLLDELDALQSEIRALGDDMEAFHKFFAEKEQEDE
jgi:serine/threonine protein kinase